MKYSMIATTYNDSNEIEQFLDDILLQSILPFEIVIADGGSKDDTVEKIECYKSKTNVPIHILTGKRLNIAEGYNEAIRFSSCEFIGITGVGNFYDNNYFEKLIETLENQKADVSYGLLGGYETNNFSKYYNKIFLNGRQGTITNTPTNHGCFIKKEIFYEVGFFYENFIYAGEDEEFYNLMLENQYICQSTNETRIYWKIPDNFKKLFRQVNNYTIGSIQINGFIQYIKKIKISLIISLFMVVGLFDSLFLLLNFIILFLFIFKYKSLLAAIIKIIYHIINTYCFLKNLEYFDTKYKVERL